MDDTKAEIEFRELQIKSICPHADQWPTEYMHQKALVVAANDAVAFVRDAYAQFDRIDQNQDLTPDAKKRQRASLAGELIAKLEASKRLASAREAVEHVLQKYEQKINSRLEPAIDPQSVGIHAQIRGQLLALKDPKERMAFLGRNGNDLTLISAALSAPPYLSGLSDAEVALLRQNLEQHAPPEVIRERAFVYKAIAEVERGWRAAQSRIAKRGGLLPMGASASKPAAANAA
jgi:hypothetical protein